jgi:hypothetical protein
MNTQNSNANLERFGTKLHDLGDKIERIAESLKKQGVTESDDLYELGDEVEHFYDQIQAGGQQHEELDADSDQWSAQANQKKSASTVNKSQASE